MMPSYCTVGLIQLTRDYMQRLRDWMTVAIDKDIELQDTVYNTVFDDWKDVPLYEMNQRPNSNFVYREIEQAQFE